MYIVFISYLCGVIKAYKYRLNPNERQKTFFEKSFGCTRFVYNWALDKRIKAYQEDKTRISWVDLCKQMTQLKKEEDTKWLQEVANQSLQSSIRHMDSAFVKFFRDKKGFPKFKSKRSPRQAFQYVQQVEIDFTNSRIKLPKAGWVKLFKNRTFEGKIGTATISKNATGKYFASVLVDDGKDLPEKAPIKYDTTVGVDVGIKDFAVCSNGDTYANPKFLEKAEKRLKVLQHRFSKKKKGSNRRERARRSLARQYERVRNQRNNFIHQVTARIVRDNQTVVIEDLNVGGMLQNHCLAKSISSAAWSEFFRQLQYKCEWHGKNLIRIGRFEPSSKMCLCGYVNKDLKLKDREWDCPECGRHNDRDLLAAINIKRFGLQRQNLNTPSVGGEEDVEWSALADTVKRQYIIV